jgi:uncharacterized protein YcnI
MRSATGRQVPTRHACRGRSVVAAIGAIGVLCGWPSVAFAHIDPEPAEAPAGSELVVGFTVEHGCDGSPTVQLDMRLPVGVTTPVPEAIDGWTASVDGDVVTFVGGPLPDDTPQTFRIEMTLPVQPGTTLYFPFVQRCEIGEIRWIDVPTDGSGTELDEPAPAMTLTEPVAAPSTPTTSTESVSTVPPTTKAPITVEPTVAATSDAAPTTQTAGTTSATSASDGTASTAVSAEEETDDASGGGSGGVWILIGSMVGVAAIAALALRQSRRARKQVR